MMMNNEALVRITKPSACLIMLISVLLELLPSDLFTSGIGRSIVQYLVRKNEWFARIQNGAEAVHLGYGSKFAVCYFVLILTFLIVTIVSALFVFADKKTIAKQKSGLLATGPKIVMMLYGSFGLFALLFILLVYPGPQLNPSGGNGNSTPFLTRGLICAAANWIAIALTLFIRRTNWQSSI